MCGGESLPNNNISSNFLASEDPLPQVSAYKPLFNQRTTPNILYGMESEYKDLAKVKQGEDWE